MAGEIEHFAGKDFRANPQNINKNGRPRKTTRMLIEQLEAEGITNVRPLDVKNIYEKLMNASKEKLAEIEADEAQPMAVRIAAKQLLSPRGWEIVNDILDRAHGKASQRTEVEHSGTI